MKDNGRGKWVVEKMFNLSLNCVRDSFNTVGLACLAWAKEEEGKFSINLRVST